MKRSGTAMERSGMVRNGQERSCKRSCKRSGTVDAEQPGMPRNVRVGTQQRFGTNSGKRSRSRNTIFLLVTFFPTLFPLFFDKKRVAKKVTSKKIVLRFKNERNTVFIMIFKIESLE
jgi:hypothetical protein